MKPISLLYQKEIDLFCQRVIEQFQPDCVVLHGSVAQGKATSTSDIDIIIIGGTLPENFFDRLYALNRLRDGTAPIEVVGYTHSEWEQMLHDWHLTPLEAIYWGHPLHGKNLFDQWKNQLTRWQKAGLRRETHSWVIPSTLQPV
jgi:predicted nucleotidyltransferase